MINVKVIADTIWNGKRITSLQCHFPRFILAQVNTHRMFSRNTASSRAVPVQKMIDRIKTEPVIPVHWGLNQAGMVAQEEIAQKEKPLAQFIWENAMNHALFASKQLQEIGLHKQIANRLLEPFMYVDSVITATEWDNFFKLRLHEDSQPEIQLLAQKMKEAMNKSVPAKSQVHLPYIMDDELNEASKASKATIDIFLELAPLSAARCARVSYLNHEGKTPDFKKDMETFQKLKSGGHWSPMEHQAIAITEPEFFVSLRCRNFIGWQQFRDFHD